MIERPASTISVLQKLVNKDCRVFWYPKSLQAGLSEHGLTIGLDTIRRTMGELINLSDAQAVRDPVKGIIGYQGMAHEFYNSTPWDLFKGWLRSLKYKTFFTFTFYFVTGVVLAVRGYFDLLMP